MVAAVPVAAAAGTGRRILAARAGGGGSEAAAQTLLFAGSAATLANGALDEELHIRGDSVAWSAGGVLRKQLSTQGAVTRAAWCYFQNTGPDAILCLLHPGALSCYTQDGDAHVVPLPGCFTGLWPLPQGVLLTGAPGQGPCILVHPLEALQEVQMQAGPGAGGQGAALAPSAASGAGSGSGCGWDEEEAVVWSSVEVPFLVTHNARHQRLAVWSISSQQAQGGFVAVTPVRWPAAGNGAPRTPVGTAALGTAGPGGAGLFAPPPSTLGGAGGLATGGGMATPPGRLGGGPGGGGGTYKKFSLRLPNGCLSPMAFHPAPRSGSTPAAAASTGAGGAAGGGALLLPSQEAPINFSLLWEQHIDAGADQLEGHLATDTNGDLLLCLLSRQAQRVTALRLPPPAAAAAAPVAASRQVELAFSLPALAVAAVEATLRGPGSGAERKEGAPGAAPPARDLLLLEPDGRLGLYAGQRRLCTVGVPADGSGGAAGGAGVSPALAQLMGLGAGSGGGAAGGAGRGSGSVGEERSLPANHSQLSGSKRPTSAAEMNSQEGGERGESDEEGEGEMMLVSPPTRPPSGSGPMAWSAGKAGQARPQQQGQGQGTAGRGADGLPDVRSLADALEPVPSVVGLLNAVGNRVTLCLAGGSSARVALHCAPTGPLAKAGLQALQAVLPADTWWGLYGRWLSMPGSTSGDADEQWQALAAVVLAWAADPSRAAPGSQEEGRLPLPRPSGASSGGTTTTTATATPRRQTSAATAPPPPTGSAAWQQLVQSEHHRRHAARFAWASEPRLPASEQQGARGAACGRDDVWRALQALHSVYEDCKMSVLRWRLLPTLGRSLLQLAALLEAPAYADHYRRDLGLPTDPAAAPSASSGGSSGAAAGSAAPPDMFRALQQLLQGQRNGGSGGGGAVPLLAQQRAGCVQRSCDLLAAYALLGDAAASLTAGTGPPAAAQAADLLEAVSHRIVRLLVRQRWTQADLDALPFGVALPLRQAIQHCRGSPPTDWPQEAYVLIGRNDIAASMAAAEQEERPAEAAVSSIVSTPLGKMAKTTSPQKKGLRPLAGQQPGTAGGATALHTPTGAAPAGLHRLGTPGAAVATPPLASATRFGPGGRASGAGGGGSPLAAPEGPSSRVLASPELLAVPYAHRLQLPEASTGSAAAGDAAAAGEGGAAGGAGGAAVAAAVPAAGVSAAGDPEAEDGMDNLTQQAASLRFGRDLRLLEVRRLLRSSAPVTLRAGNVPEPSDAEGTAAQQVKLTVLAIRTCALPLGRGALTLGTLRPLPTEPLHIPQLCLAGRLPEQNNAVVNLDFTGASPAPGGGAFSEQTAWPEFHNGVAAGLRLAAGTHQLTRTWVVYNKPPEPSYTHAGMLMALGLTGHLGCLAATDLYRYLAQEHDATIIGVLLGMAASKRGTQEPTISKTLFLHLPTRHPSSFPELDISPLVQAAALAGVGLLFQGTCHRVMAEVMLEEIGRRPGAGSKEEREGGGGPPGGGAGLHKGVTRDREGYALAAGLALGLITLGKGRGAVGLSDLHLEEKLRYFMVGGAPSGTVGTHQGLAAAGGQAPSPGDGVFGPGVIGFDPSMGEPEPRHGPLPRSSGSARVVGSVAEELAAAQGSSQVVLEGELLNLGVTSPAAALALGLQYLQTNDAEVAAAFHLPDTHFALDFVQPEQLTLCTLMRALVMWDSIQPTEEWLLGQLPPLLKGPLSKFMAGQGADVPNADYEALTQAHCCILAGGCLAMGIRFAGSANARAEALLRRYAHHFLAAKQKAPEPGTGQPALTNKDLLEECVGSALLALSVVMAGSGHLPTFKLLRALRKRLAPATLSNAAQPSAAAPPTSSLNYGCHCAVSMALGFLFMGAGTLTFGTSPEAVAALVISLFPRFPSSTMDHRCHLQAFRHLYVLAAQPRSVDAIDVDTKQAVYVPLQITLAGPSAPGTAGATAAARFSSVLRPVASVSKGASDVLADLAAQAAASGADSPTDPDQQQLPDGMLAKWGGDGGVGSSAGGVTFDRIAPCLLPEKGQVAAVRVTGPRYWQTVLAAQQGRGGRGPSLAALYATRTLFVQRKAGALPYADDPTGVRSLLSRMVHQQGPGPSSSTASPSAADDSFDLVHLCTTFGSDPFVMAFAQLFCGGGGSVGGDGFSSRLPAAAASFLDFCRGALYECITGEKPAALPTYLLLHCVKQGLSGGSSGAHLSQLWGGLPPAMPLRSLALALAYHDGGLGLAGEEAQAAALRQGASGEAAAQQWEPVISLLLLQAAWQALQAAWERSGVAGGEALRRYVSTGTLAAAGEGGAAGGAEAAAAGMMGAYLQFHGVPAAGALQQTSVAVQEMLRGAALPDASSAGAAAAAMLAATHRGLALPAAQAIAAALLH